MAAEEGFIVYSHLFDLSDENTPIPDQDIFFSLSLFSSFQSSLLFTDDSGYKYTDTDTGTGRGREGADLLTNNKTSTPYSVSSSLPCRV